MRSVALVCLLLLAVQSTVSDDTPSVVLTRQGVVRGYKDNAITGREFFAFTGIPYAKPPVGNLRFKDPVAAESWKGILDATQPTPPCPHHPYMDIIQHNWTTVLGQEDCLLLNVFTPKIRKGDSPGLPVMVWIHGGAFQFGATVVYPPHSMMVEDIVLVVIQYRVNSLGFLSTEDEAAPGNAGLKDQTQSLRWVHENIASFGGDPGSVTIFGESAGGASVHYQMLTEQSKGLYHRAILQSGSANCLWANADNPRETAYNIGKHLNCFTDAEDISSQQLVECLQEKPFQDVVSSYGIGFKIGMFPLVTVPTVDGSYITDHPVQLMKDGKHQLVDIMAGVTTDEGGWISTMLYSSEKMMGNLRENFDKVAPALLKIEGRDAAQLAADIFQRYHGDNIDLPDQPTEFTDMTSDRYFKVCQENTELYHLEMTTGTNKNTYLYEWTYRGEQGFADMFPMHLLKDETADDKWVSHADTMIYLFPGSLLFKRHEKEVDQKMSMKLVKLWANFAKTGNPTPDDSLGFIWQPAQAGGLRHLVINEEPFMRDDQRQEIRNYWNSLPLPENILADPDKFKDIVQQEQREEL